MFSIFLSIQLVSGRLVLMSARSKAPNSQSENAIHLIRPVSAQNSSSTTKSSNEHGNLPQGKQKGGKEVSRQLSAESHFGLTSSNNSYELKKQKSAYKRMEHSAERKSNERKRKAHRINSKESNKYNHVQKVKSREKLGSHEKIKSNYKSVQSKSKELSAPVYPPTNQQKVVKKPLKREILNKNDTLRSEKFTWVVHSGIGHGGFGDVYRVCRRLDDGTFEDKLYAMKTEMAKGDKHLLRLKIEVTVLRDCHKPTNWFLKNHVVDFIDRGRTDKFKFVVMSLVGPSIEDLSQASLISREMAMNIAIQALIAIKDLHLVGWLHRDVKPHNFAIGRGEKSNVVYILDFGIARSIYKFGQPYCPRTRRQRVKFLGTVRFASRACHMEKEQGRKDDLESWMFMVFDVLDREKGLSWKNVHCRAKVLILKDEFFNFPERNYYGKVPRQFAEICQLINTMKYETYPNYQDIENRLIQIAKLNLLAYEKSLDWLTHLTNRLDDEVAKAVSPDAMRQGSYDEDFGKEMNNDFDDCPKRNEWPDPLENDQDQPTNKSMKENMSRQM